MMNIWLISSFFSATLLFRKVSHFPISQALHNPFTTLFSSFDCTPIYISNHTLSQLFIIPMISLISHLIPNFSSSFVSFYRSTSSFNSITLIFSKAKPLYPIYRSYRWSHNPLHGLIQRRHIYQCNCKTAGKKFILSQQSSRLY